MRVVNIAVIGIAALLLAMALGPGAAAAAVEHNHQAAIDNICRTGLTGADTAGHADYVAAFLREGTVTEFGGTVPTSTGGPTVPVRKKQVIHTVDTPRGKQTNFGGPRPLDLAYFTKCFEGQ